VVDLSVGLPPRWRLRRQRGGATVEALREQALIEEARRRARQRRLGNLAVLALGLAVVVQVGFDGPGGAGGDRPDARPALLAAPAEGNGKLAIADSTGSLAVVNPDGSGPRILSRCTGIISDCRATEPAWSPDGMRLAFVRGQFGLRHMAMALYVTDPDSTRPRLLAHCGSCSSQNFATGISWSPDATQIVFSASGGRPAVLSLFTVDVQGGVVRRLTDCDPSSCSDMDPDWSPDGQLIVFSRFAWYGASLYTVRPDGSGLTKITSEPSFATHPRWSPDGHVIAYMGYDYGSIADIYVVAGDGSRRRLLASGSVPSWSPDGRRIVYFSTPQLRRGPYRYGSEVWTVTADGKQRRRLARFGCCVVWWAPPVWSPDGKQIAFGTSRQKPTLASHGIVSSTPKGGTFVVNSDGSGMTRISKLSAGALSWQRVH